MLVASVHRSARITLWLALGFLLGAALALALFVLDPGAAGATEHETTTTVAETTTTVAETTTTVPPTTTTAAPAVPEPVPHSDPLGDPEATAMLARLMAFALGVVVAR